MLTRDEKDEIKKLLAERVPVFKIAIDTGHSPTTVRKVRSEMYEEIKQSKAQTPKPDSKPAGWVDYRDVWPERYAPPQILSIIPISCKKSGPKNK